MRGTRKTSSNDTSWVTSDQELLDLLREGGLPAEHAGLELLLRRKPQRWEDAAGLLGSIRRCISDGRRCACELVADVSSHRGHRARHRTMTNRRRVVHAVLESEEFNAVLKRLPRAIRRTAEPASPGELGLIVEIVSAETAHRPPSWPTCQERATSQASSLVWRRGRADSLPDR